VDISYLEVSSLSPFTSFIPARENENKPADVFATIIGITLKCMEYIRPKILAITFIPKKA
jgi:hypothetical protein